MQGIDESGGETAAVHCAAVKSGIDLVAIGALSGEIVADLEIGDQHGVSLFQDGERVADVIAQAISPQPSQVRRSSDASSRPQQVLD